jgi:hypothetical protein
MEENRKPMTIQQRMARGRMMKRLAPKMARSRKRMEKRMPSGEKLLQKAMKAAKIKIRKKVAGKKGLNYSKLSHSEKMSIDKLVNKKATPAKIKALAKKLMPKVRKDAVARVKLARSGGVKESIDYDELFEKELAPNTFDKMFNETGGAGEYGTDKLKKKYEKDTPK